MKGYRTIIFNAIMALGAMVTLLTGTSVQDDVVTLAKGVDLILEGIFIAWAIGGVWFRMITDSPVFRRNREDSDL